MAKLRFSHEIVSLVRGASFVFLCRVGGAGIAFLTQVLMARWMGAEQLGVYVFAFSACVLLATISGLGIPTAAITFIGSGLAKNRTDLILGFARRSAQIIGAAGVLAAIVGWLIVWIADQWIPEARRVALLLAFLIVPVFGLSASRAGVALGLSWIPMATFPNTVFRPLVYLALISGTWYATGSLSSTAAMSLQLLAVAIMTVGQWFALHRALNKTFPSGGLAYETPTWIRTALPLLIITLFTNFFLELNVVVAGLHLDADQLAIFNAGFRTAGLIAFGIAAVDTIMMPRVSKLHAAADRAALQRTVTQAARLRFWGSLAGCVPLIFLGEWILSIFGDEFVAGYEALLILTATQMVAAVFGPAARLLSVTGYQDQCLGVSVASLITLFLLHPLFIGWWGMNGAALAVLLVILVHSAWLYALAVRHLNVHSMAFFVPSPQPAV